MRIIFSVILWFSLSGFSVDPLKWNVGIVVLADGSVLQGELSVEKEVVLFLSGGEVTVFGAHKLRTFRYYDAEANVNRKFISIQPSTIRTMQFYEMVVVGEVSVLRKFKSSLFNVHPQSDKYDFDYFIRFQSQLFDIKQFRSKIYPALVTRAGTTLLSPLHDQNLNPNNTADVIQIAVLFNKVIVSSPAWAGI